MRCLIFSRTLELLLSVALALPSPAYALRGVQKQEADTEEVKRALQVTPAAGAEELSAGEEISWVGFSGASIGRVVPILTRQGDLAGRVVFPDPARVEFVSVWNPQIFQDDFPQWAPTESSVPLEVFQQQFLHTGHPLAEWQRQWGDPDPQRRPSDLSPRLKDAPLVLLTSSHQWNFWPVWGFLVVADAQGQIQLIRQKYAQERFPLNGAFWAFVLDPAPRLCALRFDHNDLVAELADVRIQEGLPVSDREVPPDQIRHAIPGVPLVLNGRNVASQIRTRPAQGGIAPHEITWPISRKAAFTAVGRTKGTRERPEGRLFVAAVMEPVSAPEFADLLIARFQAEEALLLEGSTGAKQAVFGLSSHPVLIGQADSGSAQFGRAKERPSNAMLLGYELPAAGAEEKRGHGHPRKWKPENVRQVIRQAGEDHGPDVLAPGRVNSRRQRRTRWGRELYRAYQAVVANRSVPELPDWSAAVRDAGYDPEGIYTPRTYWDAQRVRQVIRQMGKKHGFEALAPGSPQSPHGVQSPRQRRTRWGRELYHVYTAVVMHKSIPELPDWPAALRHAGYDPDQIYRHRRPPPAGAEEPLPGQRVPATTNLDVADQVIRYLTGKYADFMPLREPLRRFLTGSEQMAQSVEAAVEEGDFSAHPFLPDADQALWNIFAVAWVAAQAGLVSREALEHMIWYLENRTARKRVEEILIANGMAPIRADAVLSRLSLLAGKDSATGLEEPGRVMKPEEFAERFPGEAAAARETGASSVVVLPEGSAVRFYHHPTLRGGLEEFIAQEAKKLPPNFVRIVLQEIPQRAEDIKPPAVAILDALLPEPPYSLIVPRIRHYNGRPFEHSLPRMVAIAVLNRLDAATVQVLAAWEFEARGRRFLVLAVQA